MTLGDFLQYLSDHPLGLILYFTILPITALLAWIMGRKEGHLSPWQFLYCMLVYLSCIPGIFAIALTLYLLFFEGQSLLDAGLYTQIVPIFSMLLTLYLIRKNVSFDQVPGFRKLSGLILAIAGVMLIMLLFEKMHVIVFSFLPFGWVLLIFLGLLLVVVFGISRLYKK